MENYKELVDSLEKRLLDEQPRDFPLIHLFTPYLYTRQIFMPAGSLIVSKIHKTMHPFNVSQGKALVRLEEGRWELIEAPYLGITMPGTRRILYILEDCIWATSHVSPICPVNGSQEAIDAAVVAIEAEIIEENPEMIEYKNERRKIEAPAAH